MLGEAIKAGCLEEEGGVQDGFSNPPRIILVAVRPKRLSKLRILIVLTLSVFDALFFYIQEGALLRFSLRNKPPNAH